MKNLFLSVNIAVISSILSISSHADPMAVFKGQAIFIAANNQLTVMPDSTNQLSCIYDSTSDAFITNTASIPSTSAPIPGAFDVKVIGNHAYVATLASPSVDSPPVNGYAKYDVSACLPDGDGSFTSSIATANLSTGKMTIPCVLADGQEYRVEMDQRGNSMNWEVIFAEPGCQ